MAQPVLVTGAAGGRQGSTGRLIAGLLLERGIPVRALVRRLDARSEELQIKGAEIIEGDLLNPASVQAAMRGVRRAYFTYPVAEGLLEAAAIFAAAARNADMELIVNNSQYQGVPGTAEFRDLRRAASFRNLQHRLTDRMFDWAQVRTVHLQAPPYFENVRALVSPSVARENTVYLPWGDEKTVIPLVGAEDVSRVAASLLVNPDLPAASAYALISQPATVRQVVEALEKAIGQPIRYVAITDEQWADAAKERLDSHALNHLASLWRHFRKGEERYQATDTIRAITGREPQTLEEFFQANRKALVAGQS
jgi:uncharacterized protein YbjT (DUF2867 family)